MNAPIDEVDTSMEKTNIRSGALNIVYIHMETVIINSPIPEGSMIEPVNYTYDLSRNGEWRSHRTNTPCYYLYRNRVPPHPLLMSGPE